MPIVTKKVLGEIIAERHKTGRKMEMSVRYDGPDTECTLFNFFENGDELPFATMAEKGDYHEAGSEVNGLYCCFKYFFKIKEREEE